MRDDLGDSYYVPPVLRLAEWIYRQLDWPAPDPVQEPPRSVQ